MSTNIRVPERVYGARWWGWASCFSGCRGIERGGEVAACGETGSGRVLVGVWGAVLGLL